MSLFEHIILWLILFLPIIVVFTKWPKIKFSNRLLVIIITSISFIFVILVYYLAFAMDTSGSDSYAPAFLIYLAFIVTYILIYGSVLTTFIIKRLFSYYNKKSN